MFAALALLTAWAALLGALSCTWEGEVTVRCGDGVCAFGETSDSCCADCGCQSGYECVERACQSVCGNNVCDDSESSATCCLDCPCAQGEWCTNDGCSTLCDSGSCSLLLWTVNDQCMQGDILVRFFDQTAAVATSAAVVGNGGAVTFDLRCVTGDVVCMGARPAQNADGYWGVDIDNSEDCSDCCRSCETDTASTNLICE